MKKLSTLVLSFALAIASHCFVVNAYELDTGNDADIVYKISEYEVLENKLEADISYNSNLNDSSLTKQDFINQVYFLRNLPVQKLLEFNYDDDQIFAIKTFDGSDEMLRRASAYVNCSAGNMANSTYEHGVRFSWTWFGVPVLKGPGVTDGVAVRWQSFNKNLQEISASISKTSAKIRYGSKDVFKTPIRNNLDRAAALTFSMGGPSGSTSFAESGYIDLYVSTNNKVELGKTIFRFYYGHADIEFNNLTFSYPLGLSVSIEGGYELTEKDWEIGG